MKILQLCSKPPLPARDGGCIAMNNITQGLLADGHKIKILTIFTHKHDFVPEELPADYLQRTGIEGVFVDTRVNAVDAFANFMTADSYNISRFFSPDFDVKLVKILERDKYDVVHLESLFMTPYIATVRRHSQAVVVLRSHNLEFAIWERIARGTRNIVRRAYLLYLTNRLRNYELSAMAQVNGIAAISDEDKLRFRELGSRRPIETVPFGIPISEYHPNWTDAPELALFHLGAMDWSPNLEGISLFLDEIWPTIHNAFPELKLYLAGRNMPDELKQRTYPHVVFEGEVDDAHAFMRSKAIMIVPLLSGGGIRVKIIEGLALGKAIVSTSIGAEGIDYTNGENILIADTTEEWLKSIAHFINENAEVKRIGMNGRTLAEEHYDIGSITKKLVRFYRDLKKV